MGGTHTARVHGDRRHQSRPCRRGQELHVSPRPVLPVEHLPHSAVAARTQGRYSASSPALRSGVRGSHGPCRGSDRFSCPRSARRYDWPGNVRELANILERAVIPCEGTLQIPHLGFPAQASIAASDLVTLEAERRHILKAWKTGGVIAGRGATLLGVNRSTLWSRMSKLDTAGRLLNLHPHRISIPLGNRALVAGSQAVGLMTRPRFQHVLRSGSPPLPRYARSQSSVVGSGLGPIRRRTWHGLAIPGPHDENRSHDQVDHAGQSRHASIRRARQCIRIPVVLLHGVTDSWRSFEPVLPVAIRAFAVTQRGHGYSSKLDDG